MSDRVVRNKLKHPWRKCCNEIFGAALEAVDPYKAILNNLSLSDNMLTTSHDESYNLDKFREIIVIGAGKGAYTMASAIEHILGNRISKGLVVTKTDHGGSLKHIKVVEGTHPLPSKQNLAYSQKMLEIAEMAKEDTLVIFLMSGGASALLPAPVEGITLQEKLEVTKILLACGASIKEINCIRKHLSRLKGGRLLKVLEPATTLSIVLSDVMGDSLHSIGSGPLASDPSTFQEALAICDKYSINEKLPENVYSYLQSGAEGKVEETLPEEDSALQNVSHILVGTNTIAVNAAAKKASELGFETEILSTTIEGEARELAGFFGALGRHQNLNSERPLLLIGGGETTVTLTGTGKGGRNQEFALAMVPLIAEIPSSFAAGFATDGTDGPTDAAGAWCDSTTLTTALNAGLAPQEYLNNNDAYNFFKDIDGLILTGPTGTNVCDIYLLGLY